MRSFAVQNYLCATYFNEYMISNNFSVFYLHFTFYTGSFRKKKYSS